MSIRRMAFALALVSLGASSPAASQGWGGNISGLGATDPLSRQYYYGCATENPSACIYAAIARPVSSSIWSLYSDFDTYDDAGKWWITFDMWAGYTNDPNCSFGNTSFAWYEDNCVIQLRSELTLYAWVDRAGPPYERLQVVLTPIATPEPTTLALLAPALLGVGAVVRRRERGRKAGKV